MNEARRGHTTSVQPSTSPKGPHFRLDLLVEWLAFSTRQYSTVYRQFSCFARNVIHGKFVGPITNRILVPSTWLSRFTDFGSPAGQCNFQCDPLFGDFKVCVTWNNFAVWELSGKPPTVFAVGCSEDFSHALNVLLSKSKTATKAGNGRRISRWAIDTKVWSLAFSFLASKSRTFSIIVNGAVVPLASVAHFIQMRAFRAENRDPTAGMRTSRSDHHRRT